MKNLFEEQVKLEEESKYLGAQEFRKKFKDSPLSDTTAGLFLINKLFDKLHEALKVFLSDGHKLRAVKAGHLRELLRKLPTEVISYITLKRVINAVFTKEAAASTYRGIVTMLLDCIEMDKFKAEHKHYVKKIYDNNKHSTTVHLRRVMMRAKRLKGVQDEEIGSSDILSLGAKLVELVIQSTGIVEVKTRRLAFKKSVSYVAPVPLLIEKIEEINTKMEETAPLYFPMIVPPNDWTNIYDGGYITNQATLRESLVKGIKKPHRALLETADLSAVYKALNALQRTPWRINKKVLDVIDQLWTSQSGLGGLPLKVKFELPVKPWGPDGTEQDYNWYKVHRLDKVKAWKRAATDAHEKEIRIRSKRVALANKLFIAKRMEKYERIFFPYNLDWRGRVYPLVNFVNPQGDDTSKALIEFAEGKPLDTREAKNWFGIHGANLFGYDKVSFTKRLEWVMSNREAIVLSAEAPLENTLWTEADKPFCFLAWCFEFKDFMGLLNSGTTFVSHLPIAMDGSCNGIQHFSAMLRDSIGGKAVNVSPSEVPQDVYQEVADKVVAYVDAEDREDKMKYADMWKGKIDRSIVKRNVMTTPYGVGKFGMINQLVEYLQKKLNDGEDLLGSNELKAASAYLVPYIYTAISEVVVAARKIMDWLQEVIKVCNSADIPVSWETPVGFKCHQGYEKYDSQRIECFWGSMRRTILNKIPNNKLNTVKQVNSIAPNFVHSMDATHLMLSINAMLDEGISSFSMIHDSFGVHAADVEVMQRVIREQFIKLYSKDVLKDFLEQIKTQLPIEFHEKLPSIPESGELDLEAVLGSEYFFG